MPAPTRKRVAAVPARSAARAPRRADARVVAVAIAVGVAALAAYANSLRNGFVWDDPIILTRQLVVFRSVGDVLAPPRDIPQFSPDYYRPLTIATYLLDRAAGGGAPLPFHLSLVLAHAVTSVLVYALALQLLGAGVGGAAGAMVAGAVFALHPIHTESVAWAAGRSDVLATGFLVAALLLQERARGSLIAALLAGLCAAAALGAKEAAVALFPLMLLRDLLVAPRRPAGAREWAREYGGPLVAAAIYVVLRRNALGEVVGSAPDALPAGQRSPLDLVAAIGTYVEKLLWPVDLTAYIDHIAVEPLTLALGVVPLVGLAAATQWWWNTRTQAGSEPLRRGRTSPPHRPSHVPGPGVPLFALAWLLLTLVPSLAIVWKIPDAPLAERYLYLPSVGFCLLIADLVARLWVVSAPTVRRGCGAALAVVLLAAVVATVRRNPVWHDDIALWGDTEQRSQVSGMAARGLGTAYQQAGRAADARAAFERALTRRNTPRGLQTTYNNLGTLAMYDGDYGSARRYYEQALAAAPGAADTLFNLGLAILQGGGRSGDAATAALPYYQRAAALSPHDSDIEAAMAQAYGVLGDRTAADQHARRALELGASGQTADGLRAMLQR